MLSHSWWIKNKYLTRQLHNSKHVPHARKRISAADLSQPRVLFAKLSFVSEAWTCQLVEMTAHFECPLANVLVRDCRFQLHSLGISTEVINVS